MPAFSTPQLDGNWKNSYGRSTTCRAHDCFVVATQVPALCWRLSREAFAGKALELGGLVSDKT